MWTSKMWHLQWAFLFVLLKLLIYRKRRNKDGYQHMWGIVRNTCQRFGLMATKAGLLYSLKEERSWQRLHWKVFNACSHTITDLAASYRNKTVEIRRCQRRYASAHRACLPINRGGTSLTTTIDDNHVYTWKAFITIATNTLSRPASYIWHHWGFPWRE